MTDEQILDLYWSRNEQAIEETARVYGGRLHILADRILHNHEDAEESVNDTYMKAWNTIPPQRPVYFLAYLSKICRNFALGKLDWNNAAKRKAQIVTITAEMENCIPDPKQVEMPGEEGIGQLLNTFLQTLPRESRVIFLRRYWYADSIAEIADRYNISQSSVKVRLYRMRQKLQTFLSNEGVYL